MSKEVQINSLSILKEFPNLDCEVLLTIEPLAPLSMVSDMPGAFYKTDKLPSKKVLCGLFENVLNWHFSRDDRMLILNDVKKLRIKQKRDYCEYAEGSTYLPLLMDFFEIVDFKLTNVSSICFYVDYWSRAFRRSDSIRHINGCKHMDTDTIKKFHSDIEAIDLLEKISSSEKNKKKDNWFKKEIGKFPCFYYTPTQREYVVLNGMYEFRLNVSSELFQMLKSVVKDCNIAYLGNSEGWVNLKIEKI